MNSIELPDVDKYIHKARNPLNSIALHAELGKMLIDEHASPEKIKNAFIVILEQCICCEEILTEMRNKSNDNTLSSNN
jgi:hypothetical protein